MSKPAPPKIMNVGNGGVRRNLFHHHLSRRPTSTSASTAPTVLQEAIHDDSNDIVVRDSNGNFAIKVPTLSPLTEDQTNDEDMEGERDKLDTKMLELYKTRGLTHGEPAELLSAVHANLKRRVASLREDNWMYEAEQPSHDG